MIDCSLKPSKDTMLKFFLNSLSAPHSGQTTTQKPKKLKKKKPLSTKNRGYCLTCLEDFKFKPYDPKVNLCVNPLYNITEAEIRYLNMCPENAHQCMIEVGTVNGVLYSYERR